MTEKTQDTITVAKITAAATILVAIISLIGNMFTVYWQFIRKPDEASQHTPTPESTSLAIEQIPQKVFAYYGNAENLGGVATVNLAYDGKFPYPDYMLDYNVPEGPTGYAGMAFQFDEGQNVLGYKAIEFTIQFNDVNIPIDFYVKDISNKRGNIRVLSTSTDKIKLRYDLGNFKDVNFNALKEVGLNSDITFSTGRHVVTIYGISFVY
jgi:hypothetical protein